MLLAFDTDDLGRLGDEPVGGDAVERGPDRGLRRRISEEDERYWRARATARIMRLTVRGLAPLLQDCLNRDVGLRHAGCNARRDARPVVHGKTNIIPALMALH